MKNFDTMGVMLDASRNGVITVPAAKRFIGVIADMGYNMLQLYTEDTYEVKNQPYFGYMRGAYTSAEIKELDAFAKAKGVELVPCIQTLAHLGQIFRWNMYNNIKDTNDILLADDEQTYVLIDNIFATLAENFTSRKVNIGMDEAHMVGLGKHLDLHGYENVTAILLRHLDKVCEIADKYGFKPMMWSDMFFRLANHGDYYCEKIDEKIAEDVKKKIPENLTLVYWDYYSDDFNKYDKMISAHKQICDRVSFAGGAWTWEGFAPHNAFSIDATKAAVAAAVKHGVRDMFLTMWGDNGKECSSFAVLPALMCAAEFARGNFDMTSIKAKFAAITGVAYDDFITVDLPNKIACEKLTWQNPSKYMLYNDLMLGVFDSTVDETETHKYAEYEKIISAAAKRAGDYAYILNLEAALCGVLAIKYDLGLRTRRAYRGKNKSDLSALLPDYDKLVRRLNKFYKTVEIYWDTDNKPFGFEIQDARLGGLIARVKHCRRRLADYVDGKISVIDELEKDVLDVTCGTKKEKTSICHNNWGMEISNSVI